MPPTSSRGSRRLAGLQRQLSGAAHQDVVTPTSCLPPMVLASPLTSAAPCSQQEGGTVQGTPATWPRVPASTIFEPSQHDDIVAFFKSEGYAVVRSALRRAELDHLDDFRIRTQAHNPAREKTKGWWAGDDGNLNWSQPLLDHPELDRYAVRHASSWRILSELMGSAEAIRVYQFDFRETVAGTGKGGMSFHHDSVMAHRFTREPYFPLDAMCTIHYLTDVTEETPAFAVVPRSNRARTLGEMDAASGATLAPIYAPKGSMVLYDNATWHTRLDGDAEPSLTRRTMHSYFSRGGWLRTPQGETRAPTPAQTNWHCFPKRLARHDDPEIRRLFSHWTACMGEWAASDCESQASLHPPALRLIAGLIVSELGLRLCACRVR